jgi:methyl-accepting chemotaxis protein
MKFRTQLILGNSLILLIVTIVSLIMYLSIGSLIQTSEWVEHTNDAINRGNSLTKYMIDQETGMRGFLITGNENYLEPYTSGKAIFSKVIESTMELINDNPRQVERLSQVKEVANDWITLVAEMYIEKRRGLVDSNSIAELEVVVA